MRPNRQGQEQNKPGRGKVAVILSFFCMAALSMGMTAHYAVSSHPGWLALGIFFCLSSALLSVLFLYWRHPAAVLAPLAALGGAMLVGSDPLLVIQVVAAITVISAICTICVMARLDATLHLLLETALFSLLIGAVLLLYTVNTHGSLAAGIESFNQSVDVVVADLTSLASDTTGEPARLGAITAIFQYIFLMIPAAIVVLGMSAAWFLLLLLRVCGRIIGYDLPPSGASRATAGFAALYFLFSLLSMISGRLSEPFFFALINICAVASFFFFFAGIRVFVAAVRRRRATQASLVPLVFAGLLVLFVQPLLVSYYGAYRAIRDALNKGNR